GQRAAAQHQAEERPRRAAVVGAHGAVDRRGAERGRAGRAAAPGAAEAAGEPAPIRAAARGIAGEEAGGGGGGTEAVRMMSEVVRSLPHVSAGVTMAETRPGIADK